MIIPSFHILYTFNAAKCVNVTLTWLQLGFTMLMKPLTWLQVVVTISDENRYSDEVYFLKRIHIQDRGQPSHQIIRRKT